ncbi:MAG: hypothetical protein HY299_13030 [Verrucomicrobia bacterium]|nr:hypothetical protein [Verrucomicrobiota bacterium]
MLFTLFARGTRQAFAVFPRRRALVAWLLAAATPSSSGGTSPRETVSFSQDIAPLLAQRCQSCHQPSKKRGGYQAHTFDALLTPGSSKEAPITPGKPEASALLRRLKSSDPDERMPQKEEALSPAQIALVENWIARGALFDGARRDQPFSEWAVTQPRGAAPSRYAQPFPILSALPLSASNACVIAGYHEVLILDRATRSIRRRLPAPSQRTFAIQRLGSGERWLLAGGTPGRSGELAILEPGSTNAPAILLRSADALLSCAVSSDGRWFAVAGADATVRVLDAGTGRLVKAIEGHADWVTSLAFNPASTRLVTASRDKTARCFAVPGGESISAYLDSAEPLLAIQCPAGGALAFAAGRDRQIHVWNVEDGKRAAVMPARDREALALLSTTNRLFAMCAGGVILEIAAQGKREVIREYTAKGARLSCLALDADARQLIAGSFEGDLLWWDIEHPESHQRWHCLP